MFFEKNAFFLKKISFFLKKALVSEKKNGITRAKIKKFNNPNKNSKKERNAKDEKVLVGFVAFDECLCSSD